MERLNYTVSIIIIQYILPVAILNNHSSVLISFNALVYVHGILAHTFPRKPPDRVVYCFASLVSSLSSVPFKLGNGFILSLRFSVNQLSQDK